MPRTLAEKILARAAGRAAVAPGEIVTCRVDLALLLDSGGPRRIWPRLRELGVGVWDPDRIVLCTDHFTPAVDAESAAILKLTRDFASHFGIRRFFDMRGIGHVLLAGAAALPALMPPPPPWRRWRPKLRSPNSLSSVTSATSRPGTRPSRR